MLKLKQIASIILMITFLFACEKSNWTFPEDVNFKADPSVAKTTDILLFEIIPSSSSSLNKNLFYRWDWDGDQVWDTDFSSTMVIKKRFLNSGEHLVYLQYADGKGNTKIVTQKVNITQGFSSPRAEFNISPPSGNFTQEFYFDASNTLDDEDSLSDLLFRWDFQGDGFWDTEFSSSPKASKKFKEPGFYHPKLEVKDPAKLFGSIIKDLTVNNTDTLIQVNITWPKEQIRVGDTVIFNASTSGYPNDPDREFKTSWYLPNNPVWTEPSYEKQKSVIFRSEGNNQIRCKIIMDFSST